MLQEVLTNGHDASPEDQGKVNGVKEAVNGVKEELVNGVKEAVNGVKEELVNGVKEAVNGVKEELTNGEAKEGESTPASLASPSEEVKMNGEEHVNGEANEEEVKEEDQKAKKDAKKKKKKWSFRSISFSKKDKSKPHREEKSAEPVPEVSLIA